MKSLSTNILINATPDEVWYTFAKFHAYELWNPFIGNIDGEVKEGAKLKVTLYPSLQRIGARMQENMEQSDSDRPLIDLNNAVQVNKTSTFKVKVTEFKKERLLRWEKRSFFLGSYVHEFRFIAEGEEMTRFENNIQMGGLLINLGWDNYIKHLYQSGLEEMNLALKVVVESDEFYIDDELTAERF